MSTHHDTDPTARASFDDLQTLIETLDDLKQARVAALRDARKKTPIGIDTSDQIKQFTLALDHYQEARPDAFEKFTALREFSTENYEKDALVKKAGVLIKRLHNEIKWAENTGMDMAEVTATDYAMINLARQMRNLINPIAPRDTTKKINLTNVTHMMTTAPQAAPKEKLLHVHCTAPAPCPTCEGHPALGELIDAIHKENTKRMAVLKPAWQADPVNIQISLLIQDINFSLKNYLDDTPQALNQFAQLQYASNQDGRRQVLSNYFSNLLVALETECQWTESHINLTDLKPIDQTLITLIQRLKTIVTPSETEK